MLQDLPCVCRSADSMNAGRSHWASARGRLPEQIAAPWPTAVSLDGSRLKSGSDRGWTSHGIVSTPSLSIGEKPPVGRRGATSQSGQSRLRLRRAGLRLSVGFFPHWDECDENSARQGMLDR